ncbi:hypothetical protein ACRABS_002697 [Salmonella enterica subsp. enterica]
MKTPVEIVESVATDIVENTSLLEVIYRNYELPPEADNAIACLIRSMQKTNETAYEYIERLSSAGIKENKCESADISYDISDAVITAQKVEELAHLYVEAYFTDKDNDNPRCYMADAIHDYAHKLRTELKAIETKLN